MDPPTQPLRAVAPSPGAVPVRNRSVWAALVVGAVVLGVLVVLLALAVTDEHRSGAQGTASGPATTALGCDIDDVATCTPVRLGIRLCNAVEPITQVEAITGNAGPGTVVTVDRFRDANGEPFGWTSYSGRNVTSEWRLLCEEQASELTLLRGDLEELNRAGGSVPASVAAELDGLTSAPAPVSSPDAGPGSGAARTTVGAGDPEACREILTGLLRDVVSGGLTRDGAEAQIPDASGTVAFRSALDGVDRYSGDGLSREEAIIEASGAFTYPCGLR